MSNVGAQPANFHEGSRSEYLAQYVFASFGTAVSVPHQEDTGVDLHCTMSERVGALSWARHHYTVQVKSTLSPWRFDSKESVRWLVEHPLPLLLCVVDKPSVRIRLYHTLPRLFVWATRELPDSLELVPGEGTEGTSIKWCEGTSFSLGAPIIDKTINDLLSDDTWADVKSVIGTWLQEDQRNLARFTMQLPMFSMPHSYATNSAKFTGGRVFQGSNLPHRLDGVRAALEELLPWLGQTYLLQEHDIQGAARAALLFQHVFRAHESPSAPTMPFVPTAINKALNLRASYVYEGLDLLSKTLDELLGQVDPPTD